MKKLIILTAALALSGCSGERLQTRVSTVAEFERDNRSAAQRAEELAAHVTGIEDIDRASVVITGNTAMVGISLAGELDDNKLMRLKTKVEKEVKRIDPTLSHVAVTASAELVERINDMADSVVEDDAAASPSPGLRNIIETLTPPA